MISPRDQRPKDKALTKKQKAKALADQKREFLRKAEERAKRLLAPEHGVGEAYYNNLPYQHPEMQCLCGEVTDGDNWAECGADMDAHLEEVETAKKAVGP